MQISKKIPATIVSTIFTLNFLIPQVLAYDTPTLSSQPIETAVAPFKDIPVGAEHYVAIKFLKDRKIIDGYEDGTFQPRKQINRAEALKIILGAFTKTPKKITESNTQATTPPKTFTDVPADAWFAPYIQQGIDNRELPCMWK